MYMYYKGWVTLFRIVFYSSVCVCVFVLQESATGIDAKKMEDKISCLQSSLFQPMLLLVGSEEGNVSLLDMRKGPSHGSIMPVHSAEVKCACSVWNKLVE